MKNLFLSIALLFNLGLPATADLYTAQNWSFKHDYHTNQKRAWNDHLLSSFSDGLHPRRGELHLHRSGPVVPNSRDRTPKTRRLLQAGN